MTSQRVLKLLSLISLIATASAIYIWRQTGEAPSPWLIRLAIAALAGALVVFVIDRETRPRFMLQFLAALCAAVALFAITSDLTAARSGTGGFHGATLLERLDDFIPSLHASLKTSITRTLGSAAWDPILTSLLGLPAYLVFAVLALICGYAGRPRREVHIFIN
jgi:uncharacterized membrane protein YfcA